MIYHFCGSSPYIQKYIEFLKANTSVFKLSDHYFIINITSSITSNEAEPSDIKKYTYKSKFGFTKVLKEIKEEDILIIHGLFNPYFLIYIIIDNSLVKKCIWSIWGGDVYLYREKDTSIKTKITEILRKKIIPQIPVITSLVKADYEVVKKVYNSKADYIFSFYPLPVSLSGDHSTTFINERNERKVVLIGNSGDPSNNHEEIFHILAKIEADFEIICPLSYGEQNYINRVIKIGNELFHERFRPVTKFINPSEYTKMLDTVNVAIMNHNRQQALGTIIKLIDNGTKVYIRSDTTTFLFFAHNQVEIYDTLLLNTLKSIELFDNPKNRCLLNKEKVNNLFSDSNAVLSWQFVFDKLKPSGNGIYL